MRKLSVALWACVFALAAAVPLARGGDCLRPSGQAVRVVEKVTVVEKEAAPAPVVKERVVVQDPGPAPAAPAPSCPKEVVRERIVEREVLPPATYHYRERFEIRDAHHRERFAVRREREVVQSPDQVGAAGDEQRGLVNLKFLNLGGGANGGTRQRGLVNVNALNFGRRN